jgi:hypothetical protein
MTYVEQLLGERGQANRRLGEEILRQGYLDAMHIAANRPSANLNVYGSTCPFCCGDLDDVAFLKTGAAACLFCRNKEPVAEQSRALWPSLLAASPVASRFGQRNALRSSE